jgi:flavin-dependent dehydrogenase
MSTVTDATAAADTDTDVLILGGGLAGLSLALQLRGQHPALRIRVLERRAHPVPEAAFKIGESTVEIAAHYFGTVLGLREHLDAEQIVKFGFRFFFSDRHAAPHRCAELGASQSLPTGAWQLDRGRFENFLGERARALGIDFRTESVVRQIDLRDDERAHHVEWDEAGSRHHAQARWVIDAAGRAGLIKRKLGLAEDNGHHANAVWFRIDGRIDIHDWSGDEQWLARCSPPERWRSTNHLVGPGYWVWLIPLSSGSHSVGIVCAADTHPLETMNSFDKAMQWLSEHQPRLFAALEPQRDKLQDFAFFRDFSYGCKQVFSPNRWALTGEAGVFLDPFYSPGSDFIAISNTYIARLISKDLANEAWQPYAGVYEQLYFSFYESTMAMYRGQYGLFGDAQVMPLKVLWDYTYYWGVLAALFFSGRIDDLTTLSRLKPELAEAKALNFALQDLLQRWCAANSRPHAAVDSAAFLDQARLGWFAELNRALRDALSDAEFKARMRSNLVCLRRLAGELLELARETHPALDVSAVVALLAGAPAVEAAGSLLTPEWKGAA